MRRRRVQKRRGASGTGRKRRRRSSSRWLTTSQQACRRAMAANILACALCRTCPTDEQRSPRRAAPLHSRWAEVTHCLNLRYRCARSTDLRRRACRFAPRAGPVRGRIVPARSPPGPDLAAGSSPALQIASDDYERLQQCDHLSGEKDPARQPLSPNS